MTQIPNNQRIEQAIKKLWSEDRNIRELGRNEVLEIGSAAAEALVNLLSDLIRNPRPRFVAEREEEGRNALEEYVDLVRRKKQQPFHKSKEYQTVDRLAIK